MKTGLTTTFRLMMNQEPKEVTLSYKDKEQKERSRVRESLEAYLLGTGVPLTSIDLNINKFVNNNQFRNVKITDLLRTFWKNTDDLTTGKKVLVAQVELIPMKNNFNDSGVINSFAPYLHSYEIEDANEADLKEVVAILRIEGTGEIPAETVPETEAAAG
jgi:hypothetical protein